MNVLVVQTAHLGDLVLTVPLLRALHAAARVTLLTTPWGVELFAGQPYVDEVRGWAKQGTAGASTRETIRALRRGGFDAAIAAQRSFRGGRFVWATRAPLRVGFAGAEGWWAYTTRVVRDPGRHAVERYLALATPVLGRPAGAAQAALDLVPDAVARVAVLLRERGVPPAAEIVALAPGSRWGSKRWLPEGFAALARALTAGGRVVVLVGSQCERALCDAVARDGGGAPVLAGQTTLPELAALLARASLVVANDSGPAHLAAAVGTPVVSIFGPTVPAFGYTPYGVPHQVIEHPGLECRPCHHHGPKRCPLGHFRCMREITPARVIAAAERLLAGSR